MTDVLIAILLVVAIVAVVYYLVKKLSVILANAVVGLILLIVLNYLHVMQWMGNPISATTLQRSSSVPSAESPGYASSSSSISLE